MTRNYGGITESDSLYSPSKHAGPDMPSTKPIEFLKGIARRIGKKIRPLIRKYQ